VNWVQNRPTPAEKEERFSLILWVLFVCSCLLSALKSDFEPEGRGFESLRARHSDEELLDLENQAQGSDS
jgi:hypothetical protein